MAVCRRPASHKFVVLSWQRVPARPEYLQPAGYVPYETMCRRCGETDTIDDMGGTPIGEYEAQQAGLEVADPTEIDGASDVW